MSQPTHISIRKATPDDAALLFQVVDMASEGLIPMLREGMAPDSMDGAAVGQALISEADGEFSYHNGYILDNDGAALGGMMAYALPDEAGPVDPDIPETFGAIIELEHLVPGHWYINMMAVLPEARGRGLGSRLLAEAESQARGQGCPGVALIVAASNKGAISTYERAGFVEMDRRPFNLGDFGMEPTDAILMTKVLA